MSKKLTTIQRIEKLSKLKHTLNDKQMSLLSKAVSSNDPYTLVKAQQLIGDMGIGMDIPKKIDNEQKSYVVDPTFFTSSFGYKDKPYSLTYETLRRMSGVPVVSAIFKTRKNQVADFSEPQRDKYSTGFQIRKKIPSYAEGEQKMTSDEIKKSIAYTDFILNCGSQFNYNHYDFDDFLRMTTQDSLMYDQMTYELIQNRRGKLVEFMPTDASTYRLAENFDDVQFQQKYKQFKEAPRKYGYPPSVVQIYNGSVVTEFYPWELCFGVRNLSTNIHTQGYGLSELEELMGIITSLIWSVDYNSKMFSQGSLPKGLFRVKGGINENALQQFRQQFLSMMSGVTNSHRTPVVEADIDWIDLSKNNRDMEYNSWMEFLIKLSSAVWCIDPAEFNFPLSGGTEQKSLFEGNNEARLKHSKDKGLYPLLKFHQKKLNKMVMRRLDPEYEFVFKGMSGMTIQEELDMDIKKMQFMKMNEIREKYGLKGLGEEGEFIVNALYLQNKMQEDQKEMMGGMGGDEEVGDDEDIDINDEGFDPNKLFAEEEDEEVEKSKGNPFLADFNKYVEELNKSK